MSCWMVEDAHIDALIEAGLWLKSTKYTVTWNARELNEDDRRGCYERGEPWGPYAVQLMREIQRELTLETADRVGQMLLRENRLSVDHRYDESELESIYTFKHWMHTGPVNPVVILKAIDCYEYQSCEHPGWKTSEAHAFCDSLRSFMIASLPGYDAAPWGIEKRSDYKAA